MSPTDALVLSWLGAVSVIGLNGFSAGVAAMLFGWKRSIPRWGRIMFAVMAAGLLPSSMAGLAALSPAEFDLEGEAGVVIAMFGALLAVGGLVSLPGAWLITRRLERPGDEHRAFE